MLKNVFRLLPRHGPTTTKWNIYKAESDALAESLNGGRNYAKN